MYGGRGVRTSFRGKLSGLIFVYWDFERNEVAGLDERLDLLILRPEGLFCPAGGFYIDPWRSVDKAVITHAHSDHARSGMGAYLCLKDSVMLLKERLGSGIAVEGLAYGESRIIGEVKVSLHPAGHVLGSAQIRLERAGRVVVVSGDYKIEPDVTCVPFEPVKCDTFITECTFGLPIYQWRPQAEIHAEINDWWRSVKADGKTAVIFGYSLGKAQRILAGLDASIGPIFGHHAVCKHLPAYEAAGIALPHVIPVADTPAKDELKGGIIVAPPAVAEAPWLQRIPDPVTGFASGWMQVRGQRRRHAADRGFVMSDHADWPGILTAIHASGCERVLATHGETGPLLRFLNEQTSLQTGTVETRFDDDSEA